jgi:uncharacterized membrane protein
VFRRQKSLSGKEVKMVNYPAPLRFAAIAGILSAYPQVAYAGDLTICNRTGQKLQVAIAYNEVGTGQFVSEGWWHLNACGGCLIVLQQQETSRYNEVYLHAEIDGGSQSRDEFIGGPYKYCVHISDRFKYTNNSLSCTSKGFRKDQVDLNKRWTIALTGGMHGCID